MIHVIGGPFYQYFLRVASYEFSLDYLPPGGSRFIIGVGLGLVGNLSTALRIVDPW